MITLQITPLSKLGDEQLDDIRRLGDTRPVLLTKATKAKERDLVQRIRRNEFTHILLGPEQASSTAFRALLKEPDVQSNIGLVVIDECHTIRQWSDSRPQFTLLGQLRFVLRQDIVWFACSATLVRTREERHKGHAKDHPKQGRKETIHILGTLYYRSGTSILRRRSTALMTAALYTLSRQLLAPD